MAEIYLFGRSCKKPHVQSPGLSHIPPRAATPGSRRWRRPKRRAARRRAAEHRLDMPRRMGEAEASAVLRGEGRGKAGLATGDRLSHGRDGRPAGRSHGTVPMAAGTDTTRISRSSEVLSSLWRMPPGMNSDSPAWRRRMSPVSNSSSTQPLRAYTNCPSQT
jgi:hypothetical protein